jgi:hypothetical protein
MAHDYIIWVDGKGNWGSVVVSAAGKFPQMDSSMPRIGNVCQKPRSVKDDFMMQMFAWQFPPDGEVFDDSADFEVESVFNSCGVTIGADECQSACQHESLFHQQLPVFDMCHLTTMPSDAMYLHETPVEVVSRTRPFLSLALPEWVHEKDAEDEIAGFFRCNSLASFPSPMSSTSSSPVNSCLSSPEVPFKKHFVSRPVVANVRRSSVSWADLAESDDNDFDSIWSVTSSASTAASSPDTIWYKPKDAHSDLVVNQVVEHACQTFAPLVTALDQPVVPGTANPSDFFVAEAGEPEQVATAGAAAIIPQSEDGQHTDVNLSKKSRTTIRWVDLVDSDLDPVDYVWSRA